MICACLQTFDFPRMHVRLFVTYCNKKLVEEEDKAVLHRNKSNSFQKRVGRRCTDIAGTSTAGAKAARRRGHMSHVRKGISIYCPDAVCI